MDQHRAGTDRPKQRRVHIQDEQCPIGHSDRRTSVKAGRLMSFSLAFETSNVVTPLPKHATLTAGCRSRSGMLPLRTVVRQRDPEAVEAARWLWAQVEADWKRPGAARKSRNERKTCSVAQTSVHHWERNLMGSLSSRSRSRRARIAIPVVLAVLLPGVIG